MRQKQLSAGPPFVLLSGPCSAGRCTTTVSLAGAIKSNRFGVFMGVFLAVLIGLALWDRRFGAGWVYASYDVPCLFAGGAVPEKLVIIRLDQESLAALGGQKGQLPRSAHARLLDHLHADHARLVVFDVAFLETNAPAEDAALADALRRGGPVVLAGLLAASPDPNFPGIHPQRPVSNLLAAASHWGIAHADPDLDSTVRRLFTGVEDKPSLAWTAAQLSDARLKGNLTQANRRTYWLRYYGPAGTLTHLSYLSATNQPPGFFRDRVVFVGGKALPLPLGETSDLFRAPFTSWDGQQISGVELVATMLLNLTHQDYLERMSAWLEFVLLVLCAGLFGGGLSLARPLLATGLAVAGALLLAALGILLYWTTNTWCAWMVVAGGQIPCALAWSVLHRTHRLSKKPEGTIVLPYQPSPGPGQVPSPLPGVSRQSIPEHTLVRRIGEGGYGEVWLARDVVGAHHAVKVVYLARFDGNPEPFEREYRGISAYSPISLSHPGLLHVLFVGRPEHEGYFYYIMELGDDTKSGQAIVPETYVPRNLSQDLEIRKRLPVSECVDITLQLAAALDHLHQCGLVHRDIKPSNIVFVNGVPKLADIGLVTLIATGDHEVSRVGTEGYIAPEGPGTVVADIYSLGVMLYRMSTGLPASQFPVLSDTLCDRPDLREVMRLNEIIRTAAAPDPSHRYPSAAALRRALLDLKNPPSASQPDTAQL